MFAIKATDRKSDEESDVLRKSGRIPAVFYGAGKNSTNISVSTIDFKKVWREAGESSAIVVRAPKGEVNVIIHEVQTDPVTEEPIHVDFLAIDMKKKVRVKVPLEFAGVSNAVKSAIGNLVKVLFELEVEALPADLPHGLTVNISKLETLNDQVFISDIKLPTGVVAIGNPTDVVASIIEQVEEKEEVAPEPVDLSAIEVEKKGKKEEEGAEGAEGAAPAKEEKAEKKEEKK